MDQSTISQEEFDQLVASHQQWLKENEHTETKDWDSPLRMQIEGRTIASVQLDGDDLSHACIDHCEFRNAKISLTSFRHASMLSTAFSNADIYGADFTNAKLCGSRFTRTTIHWSQFAAANLALSDLHNSYASVCNFQSANLTDTHLDEMTMTAVNLQHSRMHGIRITRSQFNPCTRQTAPIMQCVLGQWQVTVTSQETRIGCQLHKHEAWLNAEDQWIADMDKEALAWWKRYRNIVVAMIETANAFEADGDVVADIKRRVLQTINDKQPEK